MAVLGQMLVGGIDVLLNGGEREVADRQHGSRRSLAILNRVLKNGRGDRGAGVGLLTAQTNPE